MSTKLKKIITILSVFSIIIVIILGIYKKYLSDKKKNNIHNVGQSKVVDIVKNAKGLLIFDEFSLDNYINQRVNMNKLTVYGVNDVVQGTSVSQAITNARIMLKSKTENVSKLELKSAVNNILNENYNKLNINYFSKITKQDINSDRIKELLEILTSYRAIKLQESGFILNKLDGFEGIVNKNDLENFDKLNFKISSVNSDINGLKYVNNKRFYILTEYDYDDLSKDFNSNVKIQYNGKSYRAESIKRVISGNKIKVIYQLMDGIEDFIGKRQVDISINLGKNEGFFVPKSSIISDGTYSGVYLLSNNVIDFVPVSIIGEESNYYFVKNNNKLINTSIKIIDKLNINRIKDFSEVLISPKGYNEGERY